MARRDEIIAAVRAALAGEPGVEVASATDGLDVNAWMDAPDGGSWELHVPIVAASDLTLRPAADFARGDGRGYYHPVSVAEVPQAVRARAEALVDRIVSGGLALSALDARAALWAGALRDVVSAHDLGDEEAMARAIEAARGIARPFFPDLGEAPPAGGPRP